MDVHSFAAPSTMSRRWARRIERCCCAGATYFPLVFVYGTTTWAVWVILKLPDVVTPPSWIGMPP